MKLNNKKGSLELSVNSIVILIIAIAILGLALGFIKANFGKLTPKIEELASEIPDAPMASASEPITIHSENLIVGKGKIATVKFSVYCPEDTNDCKNTIIKIIKCEEGGKDIFFIDQNPLNIEHGRSEQITTLITFSGTSGKTYLCSAKFQYDAGGLQENPKRADFTVKIT